MFWCDQMLARAQASPGIMVTTGLKYLQGSCRSRRTDASEDPAALHAALEVLRGKKYIVTRWLQEIEE